MLPEIKLVWPNVELFEALVIMQGLIKTFWCFKIDSMVTLKSNTWLKCDLHFVVSIVSLNKELFSQQSSIGGINS